MDDFICAAYVGKAVTVLASKGLPAKTIHSLIYKRVISYEKDEQGNIVLDEDGNPKEKFAFVLRDRLEEDYKIIAIDEASIWRQTYSPLEFRASSLDIIISFLPSLGILLS